MVRQTALRVVATAFGAMLAALALGAPPAAQPPQADALPATQGKVVVDRAAKFVHFRVGNRNVKSLLRDGGVVWVATTGGVVRYDTATGDYRFFDERSGLRSTNVLYVGKLDGRIVAGTSGGLARYDPRGGRFDSVDMRVGMRDAVVHQVLKARSGDVWIATAAGIVRVRAGRFANPASWQQYTVDSTRGGLPDDRVYALAEGRSGELWVATGGGVARFARDAWQSWARGRGAGTPFDGVHAAARPAEIPQHPATPPSAGASAANEAGSGPHYVLSIAVDRRGVVWAGTWGGGLARYDGTSWRSFGANDGLPASHVFALHQDDSGTMWIATDKGLARRDASGVRMLTARDGLLSPTVFAVATGGSGDVWAGGVGGVAHIVAK